MVILKVLTVGLIALKHGKPAGLKSLLEPPKHGFFTRASTGITSTVNSYYSNKSWKNKFVKFYSKLLDHLKRADMKIDVDKKNLKEWVRKNVRQFPRNADEML